MKDDKDFIDLDSTQNWSQLDVKKEMDNREVNSETGERYDFARGFTEDKPAEGDDAVLLDGLTSGLNYIPEEFLAAADEKHEEDRQNGKQEEPADVSWAYRNPDAAAASEKEEVEEPFVPLADVKKAEEEAAKLRAQEVASLQAAEERKKAEEIEAIRQKNLEAQIEKHAQINASDAAIKANIEARKQAREALAAQHEAEIKARAEAKKEAMRRAEEEMYSAPADGAVDMFSNMPLDLSDLDVPVVSKEERIAAANRNSSVAQEENEYPEEAGIVAAGAAAIAGAEGVEAATAQIKAAQTETTQTNGAEASVANAKKEKKESAADAYAAWANGEYQEAEELKRKKRKKKRKAEVVTEEELAEYEAQQEGEDDYYLGFWDKFLNFFKKMSALDILVACTGILVVIVAAVTILVYSSSKATQNKIAEFGPLGESMQTIGLMGTGQFVAIADASNKAPVIEEPEPTPEEPTEYVEKDDDTTVSVTMSLTSVKKDLKIKFINAKTKKLVGNHEFKVNIEDAKGKKYSAVDEDMDGIIYLNSVAPGKAKVTMAELPKDKGITFSRDTVTIDIKENLEYKKIDVADEIKSESEINAKAEDTAAGIATEGTLKDTVEWVESTAVALEGGYVKIEKSALMDPANPTIAPSAKVSKLEVTREVLQQRFFASKRILVADNDDGAEVSPAEQPDITSEPEAPVEPSPTEAPAEPSPTPEPTVEPSPTPEPTIAPTVVVEPTPSPTVEATPSPSPKVDPKTDTTTPLTDKSGNPVYVKNADGTFTEAKYADYYKKGLTFYRKAKEGENEKYTGWQVIKGETYYYDKNGNYVTGEQVIQGAKYNFDSQGALVKGSGVMGIDVSKWNGNINWTAVKNSGVSFVIIRCGYRGSSTGALVEDPKFKTNIKGATDAGLKVGIYFFSQAITDVEAVEEASMTIDLIKKYKISYPVFLDVEDSNGRGDKIDSNTRTQVIQAYCQTLKNSGYTAGVYANKSWLTGKMNAGALSNYKIWLAQYNTEVTYTGKYDLWQYSSKGSVSGISGNTDMNLSYLGY